MDFKEAIAASLKIINSIYGDEAKDLRVEEVFVPDEFDNKDWVITIGLSLPDNKSISNFIAAFQHGEDQLERVYKKVTLDSKGNLKRIEQKILI